MLRCSWAREQPVLGLCISTDMTETQIPKKISGAITAVLPGLPNEALKLVEDTLEALGATTTDDLKYITEGDLLPVLKPIQARRLVNAWVQKGECTEIELL